MIRGLMCAAAAFGFVMSAAAVPTNPASVQSTLTSAGATGVTADPGQGDYVITYGSIDPGTGSTVNFTARLMRCENNANCKTVLQFANFDMERTVRPADYEAINAYNDSYPFGRAYIYTYDDGNFAFGVDYVTDLDDENQFGTNEVETFKIVLGSFLDHMIQSGLVN